MGDPLELAGRIEQACRPDRELDAAIWWQVHKSGDTDPDLWPKFEADPAEALDQWCGMGWRREPLTVKSYTASLDAAVSLVPDGWFWMAGNRDRITPRAYVENGQPAFVGISARRNPDRLWFEVTAATPALALCAAALRARAAVSATSDGEAGK